MSKCFKEPMVSEGEELARKLIDAYNTRHMLYLERTRIQQEIRDRLNEQQVLRRALENSTVQEAPLASSAEQATLYGAGIHRISVSSLGAFPTRDYERFHTETAIFPVGYVCKRKYRRHNSYLKSNRDKIVYLCTVDEEKGPVIRAEDGREWAGIDLWPSFCEALGEPCEFKSLGEFFGFSIPHLCRKVEMLGDTSVFHRYTPCDKRAG
jgi:hypothetical protein